MAKVYELHEASGPIISFDKGADTVPLKALSFDIEPVQAAGTPSPSNPLPISGHTSLTGVHLGANVLDLSTATPWYESYGLTASVSGDTVTISGTYNSTIVNPTFRILQNVPNNGCSLKAYEVSGVSQIDVSWQTGENQLVVKCYGMTQNQQYTITFKPLGYFGATAPSSYSAYSAESKKWEFPPFGKNLAQFTNGYGIGTDGLPQPTTKRVSTLVPVPIDSTKTYKVVSGTNQKFLYAVLNGNTLVRRTANISSGSTIDTSGGDKLYICMYNANNNLVTVETDEPMCLFSTESNTPYEPYQEAYTGSLNALTGAMESTSKKKMLNTFTWSKDTYEGNTIFRAIINDGASERYAQFIGMCSTYLRATDTNTDKTIRFFSNLLGCEAWIRDDDYSSYTGDEFQEAVQGYIIYELATPTEITLDSVNWQTTAGYNTFYCDTGNTDIAYYTEETVLNDYHVQSTWFKDVADAIREKKHTEDLILYEDFPDEIRTIETGGGTGDKPIEWVYTAGTNGTGDTYNYTATEDGLYLAVAIRVQTTGCSISLPDGGSVILDSALQSPRIQMKVVQVSANQRIQFGIYNSSHVKGGWIFKLNVTPSAIAYSRGVDASGDQTFVNQGTSNNVLSIICTSGTNKCYIWDKTMECYVLSAINTSAQLRILYGIDMTMPSIVVNGGITGQWILSLAED